MTERMITARRQKACDMMVKDLTGCSFAGLLTIIESFYHDQNSRDC